MLRLKGQTADVARHFGSPRSSRQRSDVQKGLHSPEGEPSFAGDIYLLGSRPFARDSSIFLSCMQQSPKGQEPGLLHLSLGETAPWPVQNI
jgi:hypothetical protein